MYSLGNWACSQVLQLRLSETFSWAAVMVLHCYGAGLHSTVLFFNPHSLKFVLPKTILGLLPLFVDRTLKDGLTVFCFVFIESISLLNPGMSMKSKVFLFVTVGLWGLSITPVSGQTATSHELPQTHLQKIRHEIVWLLHQWGHLLPSHLQPSFLQSTGAPWQWDGFAQPFASIWLLILLLPTSLNTHLATVHVHYMAVGLWKTH